MRANGPTAWLRRAAASSVMSGHLFLAAIALGPLAIGTQLAAQDEVGIRRGVEAPTAALEDLDGNAVDLSSFIGSKPLLLEFWATWCERCEALAPSMERAFGEYGDRMEFIAVAVGVGQSPRSVRRHLERHPTGYRTLYDAKGEAVKAYSAPTTSFVVIVNSAGRVAYTGVGGDQDIEAAARQVLEADGR